ncbi:hypothetical protein D050_3946B, partial [Vibrio parahaemolyticus VPCR-2009]
SKVLMLNPSHLLVS